MKPSVFATLQYTGDRFSDPENNQLLPHFYQLDAGVSVDISKRVKLQVTGNNLTNEIGLTEGNPRIIGSQGSGPILCSRSPRCPPACCPVKTPKPSRRFSRVLREAAKEELHVEFSLAGKVDYTYVSGAAQSALVEEGLPTDLGLRTGVALRHVLIDEFQDTSIAQYELLAALTATWEPGDGHTLFAVGDPMQSIYLFREAEVGLFLRAGEHGVGEVPMESLQLTRNFRSSPSLVEWTNSLFCTALPATRTMCARAPSRSRTSLAARDPRNEEFVSLSSLPERGSRGRGGVHR